MPPALVDSHCHLDFPDFEGEIDDVVARARAAGVERMVTICTRLSQLDQVRAIVDAHPGIYYAAGIHPMQVASEPMATVEELVALADDPRLVAIGETGLDYHYTAETAEAQQASLRVHVEAARQTGLPLVIHARDADEDIGRILEEEHSAGAFDCVMHCFTGSAALARRALGLGFYLSISGIATFRSAGDLRAIFAAAPLDRLLVETDSPYLAPQPHRGRRNEPAFVADTARIAAEHLGLDLAAFAAATSANFDRLFPRAVANGQAHARPHPAGGGRE
jgi:TatD DNase family protein